MNLDLLDRHADKFTKDPSGCWVWHGMNRRGYAQVKVAGKTYRFNRLLMRTEILEFSRKHGIPPEKVHVRHSCDRPECVNPDHLEVGTARDNINDAVARRRLKGARNGNSRLTPEEVIEARKAFRAGATLSDIASRLGMRLKHTKAVLIGTTWSHLPHAVPSTRRTA